MNNNIKKISFYGNEVTGPYEDVIRGKKMSYGYVVYEDGSVEEIINDFEKLNERINQAREENVIPFSYENSEKIRIHCEYDKQNVPLDRVDPILGSDEEPTRGAYTNNTANAAGMAAGAAAGYAAGQAIGAGLNPNANPNETEVNEFDQNPNMDSDEKKEKKSNFVPGMLVGAGVTAAVLLGANAIKDARAQIVPNRTEINADTNTDTNNEEKILANYRLQEYYKLTEEQATTLEHLNTGLEAMSKRCNELGVPEAAFNTDEALVLSLMMSDMSNEEAARYIAPLGYTAEDMDTLYKSAIEKFIVIQSVVNSDADVNMLDNFIIKTNGDTQRVLDAFHGIIKYNVLVNNAKEENIDKVNGTIKLEDGRTVSYKDQIDFIFGVVKSKETKDISGSKVYGLNSNSSAEKVFLDMVVSNFYHMTGTDNIIIGDTYNVDGDNIQATVAKEYDILSQDACDNTIDFEKVASLAKELNEQKLKDIVTVTGSTDVAKYEQENFPDSYDVQIKKLQEKYNNKNWYELDEETRNKYWGLITEVNNKLRYVESTNVNGGTSYRTETTTTTWSEPAYDLISETREGTGVTREEAEKQLQDIYDDARDEYEEKAKDEGGKVEDKDDGFTYSDTNEDGSGSYADVTKDDDSVTVTEIEADKPVITTPTVDDKGYVENPVTHETDEFNTTKAEENYSNEDYNPDLNQQIVQEQQSQPTQQEVQQQAEQINQEYQDVGEDWEQYFEDLESGSNITVEETGYESESNVTVEETGYESVVEEGPIEYIKSLGN